MIVCRVLGPVHQWLTNNHCPQQELLFQDMLLEELGKEEGGLGIATGRGKAHQQRVALRGDMGRTTLRTTGGENHVPIGHFLSFVFHLGQGV